MKKTIRKYTTITVVMTFAVLLVTGLFMYFVPRQMPVPGAQAFNGAHVEGLNYRYLIKVAHEQISLLFAIASAVHIVLNWKPLVACFIKKEA